MKSRPLKPLYIFMGWPLSGLIFFSSTIKYVRDVFWALNLINEIISLIFHQFNTRALFFYQTFYYFQLDKIWIQFSQNILESLKQPIPKLWKLDKQLHALQLRCHTTFCEWTWLSMKCSSRNRMTHAHSYRQMD